MKGTSKVIIGATLIMVLTLAIVLSLILVLLAELYCSLLVRRRRRQTTTTTSEDETDASTVEVPTQFQKGQSSSPAQAHPPLSRFYSHGVLNNAPRSFLFPSLSKRGFEIPDLEKNSEQQQLSQLAGASDQAQPHEAGNVDVNGSRSSREYQQHLVYISNPIFDEEHSNGSRDTTPYATPDSSPSRLGNTSGSSDEEEEALNAPKQHTLSLTPPLSPMRDLPVEACSVSLKDVRCLNTSGSGSDSHSIHVSGGSSSSSVTPYTSPSW